ncbi:MAG: hypothetical protein JKY94_17340 [Rhodobacteraceae bacterium]|nr:hypothetical protein [Paracoccaceae bacterium]
MNTPHNKHEGSSLEDVLTRFRRARSFTIEAFHRLEDKIKEQEEARWDEKNGEVVLHATEDAVDARTREKLQEMIIIEQAAKEHYRTFPGKVSSEYITACSRLELLRELSGDV